jgi:hypothetical protein
VAEHSVDAAVIVDRQCPVMHARSLTAAGLAATFVALATGCDRSPSAGSDAGAEAAPAGHGLALCEHLFGAPLRGLERRCSAADKSGGVYRELSAWVHSSVRMCEHRVSSMLRKEGSLPDADPACVEATESASWKQTIGSPQDLPKPCNERHRQLAMRGGLKHLPSPWSQWATGDREHMTATPSVGHSSGDRPQWIGWPGIRVVSAEGRGAAPDAILRAVQSMEWRWHGCAERVEQAGKVRLHFAVDEQRHRRDITVEGATTSPLEACLITQTAQGGRLYEKGLGGARIEVILHVVPLRPNGVLVADDDEPRPALPSRDDARVARQRDASCAPRAPCVDGLVCRVGRCRQRGGAGALCSGDDECLPGSWCHPVAPGAYSEPGRCAPPQISGASCTRHAHCQGACSTEGQCIAFCGAG